MPKLRAVGDEHHMFGTSHHRPLGFDEQQVAVVEAAFIDSRNAQHRAANVEVRKHLIGVRTYADAGPRVDKAANENEIGRFTRREKIRDR